MLTTLFIVVAAPIYSISVVARIVPVQELFRSGK